MVTKGERADGAAYSRLAWRRTPLLREESPSKEGRGEVPKIGTAGRPRRARDQLARRSPKSGCQQDGRSHRSGVRNELPQTGPDPMRKRSVGSFSPILPGFKPQPPDRLRPDMQKIWRDTVGRMPGGWFTL